MHQVPTRAQGLGLGNSRSSISRPQLKIETKRVYATLHPVWQRCRLAGSHARTATASTASRARGFILREAQAMPSNAKQCKQKRIKLRPSALQRRAGLGWAGPRLDSGKATESRQKSERHRRHPIRELPRLGRRQSLSLRFSAGRWSLSMPALQAHWPLLR